MHMYIAGHQKKDKHNESKVENQVNQAMSTRGYLN